MARRPAARSLALGLLALSVTAILACAGDDAEPTPSPSLTLTPTDAATSAPEPTATPAVTSTPGATAEASPTVAIVPADGGGVTSTEVIDYEPQAPEGDIAPEQADCFGASVTAPGRDDAHRCSLRNLFYSLQDPCFALDETHLMCGPDPTQDDPGTYAQVAEPLPAHQPGDPRPWLLRLADGTVCGPFGGTSIAVDGVRINYGCTNSEGILGFPEPGEPWTAEFGVGVMGADTATFEGRHTEPIETVWQ
ncbi:MAG: hypothetical protein WD800_00530 [Dehalococcoidia bacterium]